MKRNKIVVGLVLMVGILSAVAAQVSDDWNFAGRVNFDDGCLWSIKGTKVTATAANLNQLSSGGNLAVGGTLAVTGNTTLSGKIIESVTDITVVPSMVISNITPVMHIASTKGATCTVANVTTSGQRFQLICDGSSSYITGVVAVAQSGNFAGTALSLAAGDMAIIYAVGTNWYAIGQ